MKYIIYSTLDNLYSYELSIDDAEWMFLDEIDYNKCINLSNARILIKILQFISTSQCYQDKLTILSQEQILK